MPNESPRIAELRRRVESDPASIAFAQLGEEYRRSGAYQEAVASCRAGLEHHPGYLSARVTLGRALVELGLLDEAEHELDIVLRTAPDNLAAIRAMGEIYQRRGSLGQALTYYRRALQLARHDPELEDAVDNLSREVGKEEAAPQSSPGLSLEQLEREFLGLGAAGLPASDPPVAPARASANLDDIFAALGGEGHGAPPQVEALLNAPARPVAEAEGVAPPAAEGTATHAPDDLLAGLESDLRRLVERRADAVSTAPDSSESERAILAELEEWLVAIERDRQRRALGATKQ